jgi:hypothetical protein
MAKVVKLRAKIHMNASTLLIFKRSDCFVNTKDDLLALQLFWGNNVLKHQPLCAINTPLPFTLYPLSISLAYHHNCW